MTARRIRERLRRLPDRGATVRVRTTVGAVLVVGLALLVAAVTMVVVLRRSLTDDVRTAAGFRAEAVADVIAAESLPDVIRVGDEEDEFVQVFDQQGRVVASSANLAGEPAVVRLAPGESRKLEVPFEDESFLAIAVFGEGPEGPHTIVAGRTLETVLESMRIVVNILVIGLPVLLFIVGAVTLRVVGRALAPVDAIRDEVETISTAELHRRVPDPATGDEMARLATTMNQMLQRLEEGQARQRRFVSDASHELRSPVASIRQHAEVALAHPSRASTTDLAGIVLDEGLRIQRLVEDLLLLARMDEHTGDGRQEMVDLDDLVFAEVEHARPMTVKKIDTTQVSGGRVRGDRNQLARLTGNILDNAIRHARSSVAVALSERDDQVIFEVDDDGHGIRSKDRKRVFERFVRLQEARDRDSGGSGLGLAIVAEVAEVHGGTAAVLESRLGGARFEVRLPRAG